MKYLSMLNNETCHNPFIMVGDPSQMEWFNKEKKVVHVYALGDVGTTLLMGLKLLGGDSISEIGIYDVRPEYCARMEFEMNQVTNPWDYKELPPVRILKEEELFRCDIFVFCASLRVPAVGEAVKDVRMAQYEVNKKLVHELAARAVSEGYKGLYAQVSDPVDPLCKVALAAGLKPAQVKGFGLGVMNARAAYYAGKDPRFSDFLEEGYAFGPHGQDLVIANSLTHYDNALSLELTELAVKANIRMRELGFKPYMAPALSSGALSLIRMMKGEWHYSSSLLGDVFMGARNCLTTDGIKIDNPSIPDELYERIEKAYRNLQALPV